MNLKAFLELWAWAGPVRLLLAGPITRGPSRPQREPPSRLPTPPSVRRFCSLCPIGFLASIRAANLHPCRPPTSGPASVRAGPPAILLSRIAGDERAIAPIAA